MKGAYLNNISFKDLILKYLIEEISKEERVQSKWFARCYHGHVLIPN